MSGGFFSFMKVVGIYDVRLAFVFRISQMEIILCKII